GTSCSLLSGGRESREDGVPCSSGGRIDLPCQPPSFWEPREVCRQSRRLCRRGGKFLAAARTLSGVRMSCSATGGASAGEGEPRGWRRDSVAGQGGGGVEVEDQDVGINESSRGHGLLRGREEEHRRLRGSAARWKRTAAELPRRLLQSSCAPAASHQLDGTSSSPAWQPRSESRGLPRLPR